MKLDVYNLANEKVGQVEASDEVFGGPIKPHLHQAMVRYQLAARRQGTVKAKSRGEVSGSNRRMYRQKGTGRARHSTSKVPQFVGGGRAFPPLPRSFAVKLTKKARRGALVSALSEKVKSGALKVVEAFEMTAPKTKEALAALHALQTPRALVVDGSGNQNLKLSIRNLTDHKFVAAEGINVFDLLKFDQVVLTRSALAQIEGALSS